MGTQILEAPVTSAVNTATETLWTLDSVHSAVQFSVRHMMISNARGVFKNVKSNLRLNSEDISKSYVDAIIETSSIDTQIEDRNKHLKSADFFDVDTHPTIIFTSKEFKQVGPGELKVVGDLTIKGVTKEVVLNVEGPSQELKDPWGNSKIALSASTKINRNDFGLSYNAILETGGVLVGELVTLTIDAEYTKVNPQS
jgi:polyisoprenoid-binding protein YceI